MALYIYTRSRLLVLIFQNVDITGPRPIHVVVNNQAFDDFHANQITTRLRPQQASKIYRSVSTLTTATSDTHDTTPASDLE